MTRTLLLSLILSVHVVLGQDSPQAVGDSMKSKEYIVVGFIKNKDNDYVAQYIQEKLITTLTSAKFIVESSSITSYRSAKWNTNISEKLGPCIWGKATSDDSTHSLTLYSYNGVQTDSITIVDTLIPLYHALPQALATLLASQAGYYPPANTHALSSIPLTTRTSEQMKKDILATNPCSFTAGCTITCSNEESATLAKFTKKKKTIKILGITLLCCVSLAVILIPSLVMAEGI